MSYEADLRKIEAAVREAMDLLGQYDPEAMQVERKEGGDPVTEADRAADDLLRGRLHADGDGWLSEETADSAARLDRRRVWVVDPLDGTKEFVQGIPEWCVSIGLVEDGRPVAGGIGVPGTGQIMLGAVGEGVTLDGASVSVERRADIDGALVLASRSEVNRGEWASFESSPFEIKPTGSVAFKMAQVAVGLADVTWTLVPKNEWDVAGGAALVRAAGGEVCTLQRDDPRFNRPKTLYDGLVATVALEGVPAWERFRDAMLAPWTPPGDAPGGD